MRVLDRPAAVVPNDLDAQWLPFTPNRHFKADPRLLIGAEGLYYTTHDGRRVLDATSGLWCCNLGHRHPKIVEAIKNALDVLDFAPSFQFGHPAAFELASRVAALMPGDVDRVFFCNSGSEAADTALKMAIAYHRARGEGARTRLIGRERGYHGTGFGGISVGGMPANRKTFGALLPGVDHLRHTHDMRRNAFARGLPAHGAELADDLERLVQLHDASTIAAVIVEPVAGSTGVLPPPEGYLERLRTICDRHGILLIFDEVITAFGRVGHATASERFGVLPDIVCMAKGLTSAHVPMGAVAVREHVYDAFMRGPERTIELFHGYTYSGHPLACAAGLAALEAYRAEGVFERVRENEGHFEDLLHDRLPRLPLVKDVRNLGYMAGIDLDPVPGEPTKRAFDAMLRAYEAGLMIRITGDTIALSPPLVCERSDLERMVEMVAEVVGGLEG